MAIVSTPADDRLKQTSRQTSWWTLYKRTVTSWARSAMISPRIAVLTPILIPLTLLMILYSITSSHGSSSTIQHGLHLASWSKVPKVHLFVPVNEEAAITTPAFCRTMQGAVVNGWSPIIFNWSVKSSYQFRKVQGLAELLASPVYMRDMKEDDLILTMDALDAWLQLSPDVVARRFLEMGDVSVVVAAEKNCWPNDKEGHDCVDAPVSPLIKGLFWKDDRNGRQLDPEELAPRHANSGTVIGRLSDMRAFYAGLWGFMNSDRYDGYDDQSIQHATRRWQPRLGLSYPSVLALTR
ncbi:hypothetical protein BD324DRAFT_200174 [Kockovaella imperatae]|uniref:Uncharacterized protein n=1 Tax=Kockovaella imperatae TaxID=4999 RepID=A0A1Y1U6Z2_9TREE|nr:hypothetical protein BD324DRAFT_200174 [Kockovaella imperatae]ORX33801.1 hypothetical protein BD324DRAFT_200174 [Kockovaella imperatae]